MDAVAAQHPVRARFVLRDGAEAGILAAAAVLIVHFGFDLAAAEPFRTPAILHSLFQGEPTGEATVSFGGADAARYSSALLVLWFIVGLAVSFLITISDAYPKIWYSAVAVLGVFFSSLIYLAWALDVPGLSRLSLSLGALAGVAAMVGFLTLRHPAFLKQFDRVQLTAIGAHDLADAYEREWNTRARYHRVLEAFGEIPAFRAAAEAKDRHIETLLGLFDSFDLDPPEELPEPKWARPSSLEQACREGIAEERSIATMYDRFLLVVDERKLWEAFESLRWSSEAQILTGFQNALDDLRSA